MKRILPLLAALLLLSGCGPKDTPAPAGDAVTTDAVQAIYDEASQVYSWFDGSSLPTTEESVEVEGVPYYRVNDKHIKTYADLEAKVRSLFSPALSDQLLSQGCYQEIDGKLYAAPTGRGSDIHFYDSTIHIDHPAENLFTIEQLSWANMKEPTETSQYENEPAGTTIEATFGYSLEVLNYEKTEEGFRFTNFCSADQLDLDADTIYTFYYGNDFESNGYTDFNDWQLLCYLVNADGAYAEGPYDELLMRFLARPQDILQQLAILYESPFYNNEDYPHINFLAIAPAYDAANYLYPDEQADFTAALDACQPETDAEQAVLDLMRSKFDELTKDAAIRPITEEFSLLLPGSTIPLTLGEQEGSFPWGYDIQGKVTHTGPADTFGTAYDVDCGKFQLSYTVGKDGIERLNSITTDLPYDKADGFYCTPRGFLCGYTEEHLQRAYLHAVKLDHCDDPDYDCWYVYEPGGDAETRHIAFYLKDGIVKKIEIGQLFDGRILE